ncbi:MAG TPA: CocE/NonD family hydrolase [Bryobacteraceae bacterium]|nr:CocE/NonD family hydrolase [Bryobacteraceae bacterium]
MTALRTLFLGWFLAGACLAQGVEYIRAHYTKYEYQVPMRDGKKLFTSVYLPKDTSQQYPIMLDRTPYNVGPYGADNFKASLGPSEKFAREGFIFVYQDVRGRFMSEGEFTNMTPHLDVKHGPKDVDESSDTYDTIEWLIHHLPNHNGKVGMWGISYPGFYTAAGIIDAHPALKAASPQAPITDWFVGDDFHHNGALYLPHAYRFFGGFGHPRPMPTLPPTPAPAANLPDAYSFFLSLGPLTNVNEKFFKNDVPFWTEMMQHATYDEFWQARDLRRHLKNIKPAVMTVGGWFDAEDLFGALNTYKEIEKSSPGAYNILVMGPWFHGGWSRSDGDSLGAVQFGAKTSVFYRDEIEFPFFNYWLKGKPDPKLPEAYVFETGTNQWRREDAWPPKDAQSKMLYLHAEGRLSFDPPKDSGPAFDEYLSDPSKPVPYIGGQAPGMTREHMVEDQRFASTRTDVLTYQSDELTGDVTISGPVSPSLFVSTSGTDSDWVVKLIDVYPEDYPNPEPNPLGLHMGGYQQLIRGEIFRGKFRNSFSKPEPFVPGKVEKIEYTMPDIDHCFRKGHRIMVQIQSSWFPLADRNPQKFVDIYNAKASDFAKATERVYRSAGSASCVRVGVRQ